MTAGRCGAKVSVTQLSTREKGLLVSLIGTDCGVLASAAVQLVLASPGERTRWEVHSCGVACLVKDRGLHSTFIRLYCLKRAALQWEQEIYNPFPYSAPLPFFHCFQADDGCAGLNFADEDEAERFLSEVQSYVRSFRAQRQLLRANSLDSTKNFWEMQARSQQNSPIDFKPAGVSPETKRHFSFSKTLIEKLSRQVEAGLFQPSIPPLPTKPSEESLSLALRKGPLPPLPMPDKESNTEEMEEAGSQPMCDNIPGTPLPSWVPPPPCYEAPRRLIWSLDSTLTSTSSNLT